MKRDNLGDLGFSIRGGIEHNTGVYVSFIDSDSAAMKSDMKVGDQILQVCTIVEAHTFRFYQLQF